MDKNDTLFQEWDSTLLNKPISRRNMFKLGIKGGASIAGASAAASFLAACGVSPSKSSGSSALSSGNAIPIKTLISQAQKEGHLNTIALPPDWANYKALLSAFPKKYHVTLHNISPNDSSGQELQAITASRHSKSLEPDVVDVGPSFAEVGKQKKLWAPYKNSQWGTIPSNLKDPEGYWTGDYYGVIAFGSNRSVVSNPPTSWSDLLRPEYKNMVAIDGDPRSAQDAFMAVWAAALAHGGSLDDIGPGIEFFAELKKRGNFVPVDCYPANISKGTTPIAIMWDYLLLGYKEQFAGNPKLTVGIPSDGVLGGFYCQAVSAYSYHPYAARLWEEFVYSDEGQLMYLEGFAHPVRYNDLVKKGKVPASLAAKLPPASEYAKAQFPTVAQTNKAGAVVQAQWGTKVVGA